jgi:hypothetical protein
LSRYFRGQYIDVEEFQPTFEMVYIADALLSCIDYENGSILNFPFSGGVDVQPALFWKNFKIAQNKFIELIKEKIERK